MRKKVICGCSDPNCKCDEEIEIPKEASDDTVAICHNCSTGRHKTPKPKQAKSTNMKRVHEDTFVQNE